MKNISFINTDFNNLPRDFENPSLGSFELGNTTNTKMYESTEKIIIYPNPASDNITIKTSNISNNITIINVNGQVIYSQQPSGYNTIIDVSFIASGIYFIKAISDNSVSIKEVVIK